MCSGLGLVGALLGLLARSFGWEAGRVGRQAGYGDWSGKEAGRV